MEEVERAGNDLASLLASTDIAVLFLDHGFRIRRFTPAAGKLLNLLDRDVGRPFVHIASTLEGGDLVDLAASSALHGTHHRVELRHDDGRDLLVTVLPYRTPRGDDDGIVLTFVDVSDLKRSAERTQQAESRYRSMVQHLPHGITVIFDRALNVVEAAGPGLGATGVPVGSPVTALFTGGGPELTAALRAAFAGHSEQVVCRHAERELLVTTLPLHGHDGSIYGMALAQAIIARRAPKSAQGDG